MTKFTHDLETTELSEDECAAFAALVGRLCYQSDQQNIALYLGNAAGPPNAAALDVVEKAAARMWRAPEGRL